MGGVAEELYHRARAYQGVASGSCGIGAASRILANNDRIHHAEWNVCWEVKVLFSMPRSSFLILNCSYGQKEKTKTKGVSDAAGDARYSSRGSEVLRKDPIGAPDAFFLLRVWPH